MLKRLLRRPAVQSALAALLARYLLLVVRTTRWRFNGMEHAEPFLTGGPVILAMWHEVLGIAPAIRHVVGGGVSRPAHALVSRSRDGRFLGEIMRRFDMQLVHGSSSRGGAASLVALARVLREGGAIVITPDGPRGPRRVPAGGVAQLAAISGAPVLAFGAALSARIRLPTWDRMVFPLPFGRGVLAVVPPVHVTPGFEAAGLAAVAEALTAAADAAETALAA